MKRLRPNLLRITKMKLAQTQNIHMGISADESDKAIDGYLKTHNLSWNDYYVHQSIGLWGSYARQEINESVKNPLIYSIEIYQLNKKSKGADRRAMDHFCLMLIWHYNTRGERNKTPQFIQYNNLSAKDVRAQVINTIFTAPSGHNIIMLPQATTWTDANNMALQAMKKERK